jgi:hypothetical protein
VRARGLRVYDELLLINLWIDGTKPKVLGFHNKRKRFFKKKNAQLAREKEKKEIEAFYKHFGTGRERTTE